jgi:succinyl-CoA synthetase alpha subunit
LSILIDRNTKLIIQGITGREGSFHCERIIEYGTNVVAGVTPGKGGQSVLGITVYDTVRHAKEDTGANATVIFVPAFFTAEAAYEAIDSKIPLVITIAEHTPVHDMIGVYHFARKSSSMLIGPNSFGVISPGKSKAGFMDDSIFSEGRIGIMSRSATNCYETVFLLTRAGIGQSTVIGIGGDMIPGSTFTDFLPFFEADNQTEAIVIIGEIGGSDEEEAANYIAENVTKPVVALIAGKNAPKETGMGHAGAIVSADGTGGAQKKEEKLEDAGVLIAESTEQILEIIKEII